MVLIELDGSWAFSDQAAFACLRRRRPKARSFDLKLVAVDSLLVMACRLTSPTCLHHEFCSVPTGWAQSEAGWTTNMEPLRTLVASSSGRSAIASEQHRNEKKRNKKKQCNRHASEEKFSVHRQRLAYASSCFLPLSRIAIPGRDGSKEGTKTC